MTRRSSPGNRAWERKSLIKRFHPDDYDREQFELQTELQSWSLLWWEKQEQMNRIWWHKIHNWPERIGDRRTA